jgi:hypothetical protein
MHEAHAGKVGTSIATTLFRLALCLAMLAVTLSEGCHGSKWDGRDKDYPPDYRPPQMAP